MSIYFRYPAFVSKSNQLLITFHSDGSMNGRGFVLRWKAIGEANCGETVFEGAHGVIESPYHLVFLPRNLHCSYAIQTSRLEYVFGAFRFCCDVVGPNTRLSGRARKLFSEYSKYWYRWMRNFFCLTFSNPPPFLFQEKLNIKMVYSRREEILS